MHPTRRCRRRRRVDENWNGTSNNEIEMARGVKSWK